MHYGELENSELIGVCLFVGCVSGSQVSFATRKESRKV